MGRVIMKWVLIGSVISCGLFAVWWIDTDPQQFNQTFGTHFAALALSPSKSHTQYDKGTVWSEVSLYETKKAVRDRIGIPDAVIEDDCTKDEFGCNFREYYVNGTDPKNVIPDGKSFSEYNRWSYAQKLADGSATGYFEVDFDRTTKKVDKVGCFANSTDNPFVCGIIAVSKENDNLDPTTIAIGTTEDELKKILGNPSSEKVDAPSSSKTIEYKDYNLEFDLAKWKVYMIFVETEK
jgi:hypothetical protein